MEITNEIKAKVFAQYFNCMYRGDGYEMCLTGERLDNIQCGEKAKLILKPLSAITDEDAIEVAKLNGLNGNLVRDEKHNDLFVEQQGVVTKQYMQFSKENIIFYDNSCSDCAPEQASWESYQYLISKGYDLPNYLLGGKTLHEAGLAIYEN